MIIVSACLAGVNCKYNGKNNFNKAIADMISKGEAIPVCPELLGGCPTPRLCCEIVGGTGKDVINGKAKVINQEGKDMTEEFVKGAVEVLKIAKLSGANTAILKSKSPSCGYGTIYDGTFSGKLIEGNGVTSELLLKNGIEVRSL
ncbi:MAG TPA: DUF523 domain-containing protein [Clostridiaceae bacterium]|nr:DUF523 domain-containing protein [Clostridiaceae bacterium]